MAKYTILHEKDIQTILSQYNLSMLSFEYIDGGAGSSSYLLHTKQGKFVLTVFEIPTTRVENVGKLLVMLEEHHYPTTRVLPQETGELTTRYQGKSVLIKYYIEGQVYKNLDSTMLEQAGMQMARLHKIPTPNFLHKGYSYNIDAFPNAFNKKIDAEYETWLENRYQFFQTHLPIGLPSCINHADLFFDNLLYIEQDLQAIIDFEESCVDYRIFDLGMGLLGICSDDSSIQLNKARSFIKGYQQLNSLGKREKYSLQLFAEYAATGLSYWRYWNYNIHFDIKEKANSHRYMMRLAQNFNRIPNDLFMESIFNQ